MIVTDIRVAQFVEASLGEPIIPPFTCMGIDRDGVITGGVVFNGFVGASIEMTVAGAGWNRTFLRSVWRYVFDQLGCERLGITTESEIVAKLAERLGAAREGKMRNFYGKDRDAIVLGIMRKDLRLT
ncbi:MAG: GNAT family protein [Cypionkella sp.]|nr:GNAT family protein [Cypionkella sp.]